MSAEDTGIYFPHFFQMYWEVFSILFLGNKNYKITESSTKAVKFHYNNCQMKERFKDKCFSVCNGLLNSIYESKITANRLREIEIKQTLSDNICILTFTIK